MDLPDQPEPRTASALTPAPAPDFAKAATLPRKEIQCWETLIGSLKTCFAEDPRGCNAAEILRVYAERCDDWRELAFFEPHAYTRNLLERNADFELLLLCWSPGQVSPIHNHEGQNCWAAVLEGPIEEVRYKLPAGQVGPPAEDGPVMRYEQRQVMFIRDEIALHVVRATAEARAASLHLYSRPYAECNVYCDATGRITRTRLRDYSVRGQRL